MEKIQLLRDLERRGLRPAELRAGRGQCSDLRHQREGEYRPRGSLGKQEEMAWLAGWTVIVMIAGPSLAADQQAAGGE